MDGNDLTRNATGAGGVLVALLLSLKDGWRPALTKGVAGLVMVALLGETAANVLGRFGLSAEAAGFLLGGFGVQLFTKLADTVQALDLARPVNGVIERWTGAKAPAAAPAEEQPGGKP